MKPPYKVPSMKAIEAIPWNGYKVISTFSGGGGSCLGYRMAGYRVIYANEFVEEAQVTYQKNHPHSFLDTRNIRDISVKSILNATGMKPGELDIFDGSPPCSAFSMAGARHKGWGKTKNYSDNKKQQVDDLFFEYARLLKGLHPKVFIAENVSGLIKGKAKGYFKLIMQTLKDCGYNVRAMVLNAKWLGVPQSRERLIFIGVRNDLDVQPSFPKPLLYKYTLQDAFKNLPASNGLAAAKLERGFQRFKSYQILSQIEKDPAKPITGERIAGKGSWFNLIRQSMYHPCNTICATGGELSAATNCHPLYDRKFTIEELKRLSSVPDDFITTGTNAQQWERIGRMVPPVMMMNIAKTVERDILCKIN